MNSKPIITLAAVASCGLLFYAFQSAGPTVQVPKEKTAAGMKPEPVPSPPQITSPAESPLVLSSASQPVLDGPLDATGKQHVFDAIQSASVSYDPVELPRIQPYLAHPDPEIRMAALNGVVVLGHAQGAPLLREAARKIADPKEIARLLEKADWLELPSVPPAVIKAQFGQKAAQPPMPAAAGTPAPNPGQ